MPSFRDKLRPAATRKLLSLDGGGIRGMITIEVLAKIESLLQERLGRGSDFVLADYFDYVAGTSTGAIIATCVSLGMRVDEIRSFYIDSGPAMFDRAGLLRKFHYKFENEPLAEKLRNVVGGDTTLGSERLRTLLMIVLRNATTDSPWPVSNNPAARFNAPGNGHNMDLSLWQLVRASTAAPTYFPPEVIQVDDHGFVFVDGGVTMYNNPAFHLFLMATAEPYNLQWEAGEEKMLLVSIGTGTAAEANENLLPGEMNLLYNASSIPAALMFGALNEQDFLCRVFGKCLAGDVLDMEVGDMIGGGGPAKPKLFTYMRYNAELTTKGLADLGVSEIDPVRARRLDAIDSIEDLQKIGAAVGSERIKADHFEGFLE